MSGFMFQSEHERNRSNTTGSLLSTDLHDIPKSYDLHIIQKHEIFFVGNN